MGTLLTALLSGAAGILLSALAHALRAPGEVGNHDAAIRGRDRSLSTWIADRHYAVQQLCELSREAIIPTSELPPPPHSWFGEGSGEDPWKIQARRADEEIAEARSMALWEYRDECARADLDIERILASERWPHRVYRRLARRAVPRLTAPEQATPIIQSWRLPSAMSGEAQVWPDDATQRTLARALRSIPVSGP